MLKYFDGGPVLNLIFLIIAILSIIIAIYHGRKIKKLVFNLRSNILVTSYGNALPQLEILYKGVKVPNVTIAKVAIWNAGNDVINRQDIPNLDGVRIILKKPFEFLETSINYIF